MSDDFLKEIQECFLAEASDLLAQAESLFLSLEKSEMDHTQTFDQLKRLAHNFKGSGKAVGFDGLSTFSHTLENLLIALSNKTIPLVPEVTELLLQSNDALLSDIANLKQDTAYKIEHIDLAQKLAAATNGCFAQSNHTLAPQVASAPPAAPVASVATAAPPPATQTEDFIRIPMRKIDDLLNSFGEQVILLSALDHYTEDLHRYHEEVLRTIFDVKKLASDLQQSTLTLRMVTLKQIFSKLERAVRDSARMIKKQVRCDMIGMEQELDKAIVEQLSDPLTHMVRNAVDHGLETPEERLKAGKPEMGRVTLVARREGGGFVIEVSDDGRGMDPEKIRKKAIEKRLISPDAKLSRAEIFDLLFENGFSTKEQVSELSGRGVGMNVVKEMILALKGSYEIESEVGKGTCFRIRLPLSLSLFNGILVGVNDDRFIIPSSQVVEIVKASEVDIRTVSPTQKAFQLRDLVLELTELPSILRTTKAKEIQNNSLILISEQDGVRFGLLIHQIYGIRRVVQKPISPEMTVCPGGAGVTIMGDGAPAIILDLRQIRKTILANSSRRAKKVVSKDHAA